MKDIDDLIENMSDGKRKTVRARDFLADIYSVPAYDWEVSDSYGYGYVSAKLTLSTWDGVVEFDFGFQKGKIETLNKSLAMLQKLSAALNELEQQIMKTYVVTLDETNEDSV